MKQNDEMTEKMVMIKQLMHRFILVLMACVLVIVLGHRAWSAENPGILTVEKALELAAENNPVISATRQKVVQSREKLNQAKADQYPKLAASMAYQQTGEDPYLPVYSQGMQIGYAQDGFRETYKAAIELTWLIYSGGAVKYNVQAKELALDSVQAQAVRTGQAAENGVYNAFYNLQRARAKLVVADEALRLARRHLREVNLFYENGVVAKNQVLRVQVEVSDSELNRIKAANAVDLAWSALERTVGIDLKKEYSLPETKTLIDPFEVPDNLQDLSINNRPELQALEKTRLSALALARSAAGSGGPQVVLKGETYEVGDEFFPDVQDDWKITVAANWNFFDGGESKAKEAEAKATAEEVLFRIEDFKKQIRLEVKSASLNLRSASQRVEVAKDQVKSAEEDYRIALKRYKAQVGTNLDVLDSRVALINAKTKLADSIYDNYQSRADLLYALGLNSYSQLH